MERLLTPFLAILLAFSMQAAQAQQLKGDTWEEVKRKGSGTIVLTYIETPAYSYSDKNKKPAGVCVDIMNDFVDYMKTSKKINLTVRYEGKNDNFSQFFNNVKASSGGVFGLGNITITEERKKIIKYSPPFATNITVLMTHNSVAQLDDIANIGKRFKGMTAYTVTATTNAKNVEEIKKKYMPDLKIVYLAESVDAIEKIAADKNSFTILDFTYYNDALKNRKLIVRHPSADNSAEKFGMIMPLNSDWSAQFNEYFARFGGIKKNPIYKKSVVTHLGESASKLLDKIEF